MDLFGLTTGIVGMVNPDETVKVKRFNGYTIGAGRKQVPNYKAPVEGTAQIQDLTSADLKQIEGMNIQGVTSVIYLQGSLAGVVRPDGKGGDLVLRGSNFSETWLVVKVVEAWPDFTKAIICRQMGA